MSEATQALESQLQAEKQLVEMRAVAQRLSSNPDFRRLILDEYMVYEPARLAMMSGDPILTKEQREDALHMAQAAGHLKRYLSTTIQRGNASADNIIQIEAELEEVRAEEANS